MTTLILPVAGKSSRFPGMRPKWLLTMPNGSLMIESAIELFNNSQYERVIIVALKEHIDKYISESVLKNIFKTKFDIDVEICVLPTHTRSQSETIASAIKLCNINGPFFIKDCDNRFEFTWNGGNEIAVVDLNDVGLIDAKNKSYIKIDSINTVSNIVEKNVISNLFCCGGYGFSSAKRFIEVYDSIDARNNEVYVSHIIYKMLLDGDVFNYGLANKYIDWGTLREYRYFTKKFLTVFCDVDGVLFYNGSKFGNNGWKTKVIEKNLEIFRRMEEHGLLYLVITSSRPESEIEYIKNCLKEYHIFPKKFVMDLPHSKRVLINDYSATNPYPSAIAVNLQRDNADLTGLLQGINE